MWLASSLLSLNFTIKDGIKYKILGSIKLAVKKNGTATEKNI